MVGPDEHTVASAYRSVFGHAAQLDYWLGQTP
jgi:hypothetical protein